MKRKSMSFVFVLLIVLNMLILPVLAEEPTALVSHGVSEISDRGNMILNLRHEDVLSVFDYGDLVTVTLGKIQLDVPIVDSYCVDAGEPLIYLYQRGERKEVRLVSNMKSFALQFEIAYQPDPEGKPTEWVYNDGFSADMDVTVTMKEKAGYLEEYKIRSMVYSKSREDFPSLTDAEFANFRMVDAGDIAPGVLYRSATPIDPKNGRNTYSDAAAQEAGVTVFVNLADSKTSEEALGGFLNSYYSKQKRISLEATMDFSIPENRKKLADGLRFMAENPGVYDVFCVEGKDRTGFFLVVLEGLMNASSEEMERDYALSFYNYYGITPGDEAYSYLMNGNYVKLVESNLGANPREPGFQQAVETYVKQLGLTDEEIVKLKTNLSGGTQSEVENEETAAPSVEADQMSKPQQKNQKVWIAAAVVILAALCGMVWKRTR